MEINRSESDEDEVLTVPEAAKFLKICQQSVRNAYNRGELKGFRFGSTYRFYKRGWHGARLLDPHVVDSADRCRSGFLLRLNPISWNRF